MPTAEDEVRWVRRSITSKQETVEELLARIVRSFRDKANDIEKRAAIVFQPHVEGQFRFEPHQRVSSLINEVLWMLPNLDIPLLMNYCVEVAKLEMELDMLLKANPQLKEEKLVDATTEV
jgi:hypothetical protein